MNGRILFAVVLAAVMIGAVLAPMGTVAAADVGGNGDDIDLEVGIEQNETVTVTVSSNDSAVSNATVNVSVDDDENASYDGVGEYETDDDGLVELPEPEETVNVTVEATYENTTAEATTELEAKDEEEDGDDNEDDEFELALAVDQTDDVVVTLTKNDSGVANATVEVIVDDENVSYADEGNHTTDENGTVSLVIPEKTVNVTIEATYENESASASVTLEAEDDDGIDDHENFGSAVSAFVHDNMDYAGGPFGQLISQFATTHNPGVGPADHAGPPGHVTFSDDEQGPPEHAGGPSNTSDDDESDQGPPSHAGGQGNESDGGGQGPPGHADDEDDE